MIAYLHINGEIGDLNSGNEFTSLQNLVAQYQSQKKNGEITSILVTINSPGGSLKEGKDMYDFLTGLKKQGIIVNTKGVGIVGSSATQPFLAGQERTLEPDCDFFIHNPQGQPPKGDADSIAQYATAVKKEESKMLNFYVEQTDGDKTAIQKFMENETNMASQDAIDLGFATALAEPMKLVAKYEFEETKTNNNNSIMMDLTAKLEGFKKDILNKIEALSKPTDKRLTAWQEKDKEVTAYVDLTPADASIGQFISVNVDSMENIVGGQAVAVDDNGNFNPLAAGDYDLADGSTLKVGENSEVTEYMAAEATEEMDALKKENEELKAQLEASKKEVEALSKGVAEIKNEVEKKLVESAKVVTEAETAKAEAEAMKENIVAIATTYKVPKDKLTGLKGINVPTTAERITAIQSSIKKEKSIKEQLTA